MLRLTCYIYLSAVVYLPGMFPSMQCTGRNVQKQIHLPVHEF